MAASVLHAIQAGQLTDAGTAFELSLYQHI
jgi:hypothetical protein